MKNKPLLYIFGSVLVAAGIVHHAQAQPKDRPKLETVAAFGKNMAIGLSVSATDRLFVSFPNFDGAGEYALTEVVNGKLYPYPDKIWNIKGRAEEGHFFRIQDLFVDDQDNLWVLDSKPAPGGDLFKTGDLRQKAGLFALFKINLKTNKVEKTYTFPDIDKSVSALNDVRVDPARDIAYLSDPGQAAIVVLDLVSGKSRTVLAKSGFTSADPIVLKYDGNEMRDKNGRPFSSNVNGIALTHDGKYFYFKPINKEDLFRIETRYLRDIALSEKDLEARVEDVGKVGVVHGLIADKAGNIYLTTSEKYAISYLTPKGQLKVLVSDRNLIWPDSMGIGGDGYLYVSCSQLQQLPHWNNGKDRTQYPYRAYRVKLPVN